MKLEEQVCSLELAKKLKDLSVEQESLYCYALSHDNYHPENNGIESIQFCSVTEKCPNHSTTQENIASAFTVAELGEILPDYIETHHTDHINNTRSYYCRDKRHANDSRGKTEANARAKMVIENEKVKK